MSSSIQRESRAAGGTRSGTGYQAAVPLRLSEADLARLVALAARAPSVHNTQPWRFRRAGDTIELVTDPLRKLTRTDPAGRELLISCGAALFGLRLGLRGLGYRPAVRLLPDPAQADLLARVSAAGREPVRRDERDLIAAVPHRHTHRGPFNPGEISSRLLDLLARDAAAEGAELVMLTGPARLRRLAELTAAAAQEQAASREIRTETYSWARPLGDAARDGVPASALPTTRPGGATVPGRHGDHAGQRLAQRDYGQPGILAGDGSPPPVTAVLVTAGDGPVDWLQAGQALHRLLLQAASRWVFASLQSQPLESPGWRAEVQDAIGHAGVPQLLLQFGRANTAQATPRRPVAEIID